MFSTRSEETAVWPVINLPDIGLTWRLRSLFPIGFHWGAVHLYSSVA